MAKHSYHAGLSQSVATPSASGVFQMPSYTSHAARSSSNGGASSPSRSKKHASEFAFASVSPGKPSRLSKPSQRDSDQSLLEMLSSTVACLKQKHMDLEALGCLEQSLWLKRRMFGVDNSVVHRALNEVVLSYNSVAMQYLAQAQFDQCLAMLRKAEAITAPGNFRKCQSLQILTFNNIGCCYRKLGKLKSALKYLKEAAQLGATCAHVKNLSITHLNLCAIQSQLGRHDLALEHAQAAIFHTQEELVSMEAAAANSSHRDDDDDNERTDDGGAAMNSDVLDAKSREEKIISLAVAYHNLAVELEFNGRGDASLQWYKKALQLVWKYRESNAALCASFKKIFMDAKHKLELQRSGGGGASGNSTGAHSSRPTHSSSHATSRSANASGTDRRKPLVRPQSAHPRSGSGASGSDLSYSANVAAQCYKPMKPSTAGLQYTSTLSGGAPPDCARRGGSQSGHAPSRASRPSSAHASAASSSRQQRPLSASASRSTGTKASNRSAETGANIEAHWRRLEREFALESSSDAVASTQSAQQPQQQHGVRAGAPLKRPQSARVSASASLNQRDLDAFARHEVISDLDSGDDDDCDVFDDDEPSDNDGGHEENEALDQSDDVADLLLRRDSNSRRQSEAQRLSSPSRGHDQSGGLGDQHTSKGLRHRQALDEARRKTTSLAPEHASHSRIDGRLSTSSLGLDDSNALCDSDNDESELLPHQRVSHMAYLRRMKRLAENIKDDLIGNVAPSGAARGGGSMRPAATASAPKKPMPPPLAPRAKSAVASSEQGAVGLDPTERRESTSKVRERLERVRSESAQSLPLYDDLEKDSTSAGRAQRGECDARDAPDSSATTAALKHAAALAHEVIEVVRPDGAFVCATDQAQCVAEQALVRSAAAKRIQAFVRGAQARDAVHKWRQVRLCERELTGCRTLVAWSLNERLSDAAVSAAPARRRGCASEPHTRQTARAASGSETRARGDGAAAARG